MNPYALIRQDNGIADQTPTSASRPKIHRNTAQRRRNREDYIVHEVFKALDTLEAFGPQCKELGLSEIAATLALPSKAALRYLKTLERRGYLSQDPERGTYSLGIKTLETANVFFRHLRLGREANRFLDELVAASNETAYLAVIDGPSVTYLEALETSRTLRVTPRIGPPIPIHSSAAGKVHLAFGPRDRVGELIRALRLPPLTRRTMTDSNTLREYLRVAAERGYAVDDEETEVGVRCVATPVLDQSCQIVAAIGLTGPAERLPLQRIEGELAPLVKEAGAALSRRLGYSPA